MCGSSTITFKNFHQKQKRKRRKHASHIISIPSHKVKRGRLPSSHNSNTQTTLQHTFQQRNIAGIHRFKSQTKRNQNQDRSVSRNGISINHSSVACDDASQTPGLLCVNHAAKTNTDAGRTEPIAQFLKREVKETQQSDHQKKLNKKPCRPAWLQPQ